MRDGSRHTSLFLWSALCASQRCTAFGFSNIAFTGSDNSGMFRAQRYTAEPLTFLHPSNHITYRYTSRLYHQQD